MLPALPPIPCPATSIPGRGPGTPTAQNPVPLPQTENARQKTQYLRRPREHRMPSTSKPNLSYASSSLRRCLSRSSLRPCSFHSLIFIAARTIFHRASLRIVASSAVPFVTVMTSPNLGNRLMRCQSFQYSHTAREPAAGYCEYDAARYAQISKRVCDISIWMRDKAGCLGVRYW